MAESLTPVQFASFLGISAWVFNFCWWMHVASSPTFSGWHLLPSFVSFPHQFASSISFLSSSSLFPLHFHFASSVSFLTCWMHSRSILQRLQICFLSFALMLPLSGWIHALILQQLIICFLCFPYFASSICFLSSSLTQMRGNRFCMKKKESK